MSGITWKFYAFDELDTNELYAIMRLRNIVFVVEQNCPYLDADGKDQGSFHLCGWQNGSLAAYARILPPGLAFEEASIGRVVTDPLFRRTGAGKQLMEIAIQKTFEQFPFGKIRIGAQLYLQQFYSSLGFKKVSEQYLEDDIPHIEMLLTK